MYRCVCVCALQIPNEYFERLYFISSPGATYVRSFIRSFVERKSIYSRRIRFVVFSSSSLNRFVSFPFLISQTSSDKNRIKIGIRFSFPSFFLKFRSQIAPKMAALSASTRSKAHENITLLNRQQNKLIRSKISGTKHIKYHHQFFDCGKFNETPKSIRKIKELRTFQNERIRIPFVCSFFVFVALVVRSASLNMFYFILFSFLVSTNLWEDEATLRANTKYLQLLSRSNRVSLGGPGKFKITS